MTPKPIFALAAAAFLLAGPALADTKAGVDAWGRGDYRKAVDEWRAAANAGDADAQFNLGQAYKLGRGVPVDTALAEQWYGKATLQGHVQASDNYGLALFQNGKARDAIPYLERSAARGEPRAQYVLGTMLFNGVDIPKDWVRAYALMTRASAQGLPQGTTTLAQMDGFIPMAERQRGIVLARQFETDAQRSDFPPEIAGTGSQTAMRGVDLPPSTYGAGAAVRTPPPPPRAGQRVPPPVYTQTPVTAPPAPRQMTDPGPAGGNWRVQLGAFGDPGNARRLWSQLAGRFPGSQPDYVRAGTLTKLLAGPFTTRAEAQRACGSVKPCVVVAK